MDFRLSFALLLSSSVLFLILEAKTVDPYEVLGIERNASQREIQKAFHKLSLQYHPDKNKNKGAQEKFAEINNAYDMLSDEEKRKNYDMYGDKEGQPGFGAGHPGDQSSYTYFTGGGSRQNQYTFRPGEWQGMGSQGGSRSFSFSFGGSGDSSSFGFGMDDIFSNLFGGNLKSGSQFGGFGAGTQSQSGSRNPSKSMKAINSQIYKKEIVDQGMTWLLFSCTTSLKAIQSVVSLIEEVANSLQGALKVGSINCQIEQSLCKGLGIFPQGVPRVFVYSLKESEKGSLVEYNSNWDAKSLKTFCQYQLPRFSKRVDLKHLEFPSLAVEKLPTVILLSTKKDTPVIWRVLSGLYRRRFIFYDAQVHDESDATVKKIGVDALPAVVGWMSTGEKHILKTGISVRDLKSAVHDLSNLLDGFEKKNKKAASSQTGNAQTNSGDNQLPMLTGSNFDGLCGETTPVCIIGAFTSLKARSKIESILKMVSQKTLSRRQNSAFGTRDTISYSLLDATKQPAFLTALDNSGFKSIDKLLVAYKRRKGKFTSFEGEMTLEEVERFISSVLNGDIRFSKIRQKPVLK